MIFFNLTIIFSGSVNLLCFLLPQATAHAGVGGSLCKNQGTLALHALGDRVLLLNGALLSHCLVGCLFPVLLARRVFLRAMSALVDLLFARLRS